MESEGKKRFPLREAYAFAESQDLAAEAAEIRDMEIEWDRPITSSVRRGRIIMLFERKAILEPFTAQFWPFGLTPSGQTERNRCLRLADEYDAYIASGAVAVPGSSDVARSEQTAQMLEFALEAHLRDFLAKNLERIEPGLRLYVAAGRLGVEFPIDNGRIDLLTIDVAGRHVVIELKLSQGRNKTLGQLLYYMGWVDRHLGNAPCRGVIVAADISEELVTAVSRVPGVTLARYRMSFQLEQVAKTT